MECGSKCEFLPKYRVPRICANKCVRSLVIFHPPAIPLSLGCNRSHYGTQWGECACTGETTVRVNPSLSYFECSFAQRRCRNWRAFDHSYVRDWGARILESILEFLCSESKSVSVTRGYVLLVYSKVKEYWELTKDRSDADDERMHWCREI
jgi:hypothetical protein